MLSAAAAGGLAVAAAAGQFGITTTVRAHGGLALAAVLGARQPASVALSCALFGHALVPAQALGAAVAFAALLLPRGLRRGPEAPPKPRGGPAAAAAPPPPVRPSPRARPWPPSARSQSKSPCLLS